MQHLREYCVAWLYSIDILSGGPVMTSVVTLGVVLVVLGVVVVVLEVVLVVLVRIVGA